MTLSEYKPIKRTIDFRAALCFLEKGARLTREAWQDSDTFIYIARYEKNGQLVRELNKYFSNDRNIITEISLSCDEILANDWFVAPAFEWLEDLD